MKRKTLFVAAIGAALATFGISSAQALSSSRVAELKKAVANLPTPELAAKAGLLVSKADANERAEVAIVVARTIITQKPSLAPAVVGSISKAFPESSADVAAEAARISTSQAAQIVTAATSAAPEMAGKIAGAVARVTPKTAVQVTRTAVLLVPDASAGIVENVSSAVPSAKQDIQNDAVITRVTRSRANTSFVQGTIGSFPGTIRGIIPTNPDGTPKNPNQVTVVTPGSDSDREDYGTPQ